MLTSISISPPNLDANNSPTSSFKSFHYLWVQNDDNNIVI